MLATVAISVARPRWAGAASSVTAAVAAPLKSPAEKPENTRPTNSSGRACAARKQPALSIAKPTPTSRTGRRPSTSENDPAISRAAITPQA